ncbi:DMT family transporter [Streptomyces atratus]|uniref:EamA family transporter n=1 Tax=Streptomyces atratus TaxID=1893 RepID=UPI003696B4E6
MVSSSVTARAALGPVGVVAVRQWVAAVLLLSIGRPRLTAFTRRQWWPVLGLALSFATMNLGLYSAIDRIGMGLAVTLEFLGPLAVALASSRRPADAGYAVLAAGAVAVLARPQPATDYTGIAFGLLAAASWAACILLNRTVGARVPGAQGSAAAAALSGLLYLPVGIQALINHHATAQVLTCAAVAGLLSSAAPFLADLLALRKVPARFFGIFMSFSPVCAALIGLLLLGQSLHLIDWLAIAAIVTANTASLLTRQRPG